ncbi:MAG TPA: energy-coupling factor ABC transporter substrate-binding protein [Firmicutes bacterium]|jgi:cobalt/nickel transport protein|nr:energy-coupling factor ABC transporter substrate-binding protein [Bacillota bacterium]
MSHRAGDARKEQQIVGKNILLIILVIAIAVIPLIFQSKAEFAGADDQAKDAISQIDKGYKPWFHSIWTPPSAEIESLLFALQAGIGSLVIGYYIGFARGRKKTEEEA